MQYGQYGRYLVMVATSVINGAETERLSCCWKFENTFPRKKELVKMLQNIDAKMSKWLKINKVLKHNCFRIVQIL